VKSSAGTRATARRPVPDTAVAESSASSGNGRRCRAGGYSSAVLPTRSAGASRPARRSRGSRESTQVEPRITDEATAFLTIAGSLKDSPVQATPPSGQALVELLMTAASSAGISDRQTICRSRYSGRLGHGVRCPLSGLLEHLSQAHRVDQPGGSVFPLQRVRCELERHRRPNEGIRHARGDRFMTAGACLSNVWLYDTRIPRTFRHPDVLPVRSVRPTFSTVEGKPQKPSSKPA